MKKKTRYKEKKEGQEDNSQKKEGRKGPFNIREIWSDYEYTECKSVIQINAVAFNTNLNSLCNACNSEKLSIKS